MKEAGHEEIKKQVKTGTDGKEKEERKTIRFLEGPKKRD
jgi:hypothetical protein